MKKVYVATYTEAYKGERDFIGVYGTMKDAKSAVKNTSWIDTPYVLTGDDKVPDEDDYVLITEHIIV